MTGSERQSSSSQPGHPNDLYYFLVMPLNSIHPKIGLANICSSAKGVVMIDLSVIQESLTTHEKIQHGPCASNCVIIGSPELCHLLHPGYCHGLVHGCRSGCRCRVLVPVHYHVCCRHGHLYPCDRQSHTSRPLLRLSRNLVYGLDFCLWEYICQIHPGWTYRRLVDREV
jgi:hypothetical protein